MRDHYEKLEVAEDYRRRFSKSWSRRLSHRLELRMLSRALRVAGPAERALDVPCGAGRMAGLIARHARELVCVDAARAMLDGARRSHGAPGTRFVQGSALDLPFAAGTFDVTVCWRLLHHFATAEERLRLLRELARVTRRAVVVSFWDAGTSRARRIARQARPGSGRFAVDAGTLASEAAACRLAARAFGRLFGPFSPLGAVVLDVR